MNKREEQIIRFLAAELEPYLIVLFGSTIKGNENQDSDVDIGYLSDKEIDHYERFMKSQELASILNKEVDLVDLKKASTVFQAQIVGTGKVIFCADDKRRMEFEMMTLKMYAKLNEEREIIMKDIEKRGSIYEE
ncbi:type VII toxin-antitoxin system MntA family adenylyltransferase antitoxin [Fictibacillus fluitans]|uniref:Nucleotidyltransferase domain-containing protein n=1 Tax=Fictibacillus fluitans TaxID=3058422 RepID=A0ABT8HTA4_9BACL|nr:nucleotidyltransferase domain-containing protein [Fictibacillus sp. NE201]MDN4524007.1 nucleotidyltransferase domain-containing protein [Fictibacillus sp. NE201]